MGCLSGVIVGAHHETHWEGLSWTEQVGMLQARDRVDSRSAGEGLLLPHQRSRSQVYTQAF